MHIYFCFDYGVIAMLYDQWFCGPASGETRSHGCLYDRLPSLADVLTFKANFQTIMASELTLAARRHASQHNVLPPLRSDLNGDADPICSDKGFSPSAPR